MSALKIAPTAPWRLAGVRSSISSALAPTLPIMWESEGDDLSGIGRVGQYFLIAGERGVEDDFGLNRAGRAQALAFDHGSIGEDENGGSLLNGPGCCFPGSFQS